MGVSSGMCDGLGDRDSQRRALSCSRSLWTDLFILPDERERYESIPKLINCKAARGP